MLGRSGRDFGRMGLVAPSGHFAGATLDLNFAASSGYPSAPASLLTTTRASDAYADDTAGSWTLFSSNVPRLTDKGLLVEESRTNSIRNNSMQGASAPSTLPTNWATANAGGFSGITATVIGTGTESGIGYIDIQFSGTPGATNTDAFFLFFDTTTGIAATNGQAWTPSVFLKLVAGSWTNVTNVKLGLFQYSSAPAFLSSLTSAITSPTSAALGTQRFSNQQTTNDASTAAARPLISFGFTSGAAADFTLRIGWPQLELGSFATSPIRTTSAAATRAADANTTALAGTSEGAVVVYARTAPGLSGNQFLAQWDDGTANNRIYFYRSSGGNIFAQVITGGVNQAIFDLGVVANSTAFKVALSWKANDFVAVLNGGTPSTDGAGSVPTGLTTFRHGASTAGNQWNSTISREAIFPAYLSGPQLQALTT